MNNHVPMYFCIVGHFLGKFQEVRVFHQMENAHGVLLDVPKFFAKKVAPTSIYIFTSNV